MKKSEKLYNSFSSIRDEWLDDAISANTNNNIVIRKKVMPLRRLLIAAVVCVLCSSLAITCFAYADMIKSIFQREKELIDPYAIKVGNSVTVGDITLTIDKVAWGSSDYYVYYTLKNNNGIFDKGLTYDRIAVRESPWDYPIDTVSSTEEEKGSNPNSSIAVAGYGLDNPSDTINTMFRTDLLYGNYKFAFENVTSYDGSIKYADEIVFDLELPAIDEMPGFNKNDKNNFGNIVSREFKDTFVIEGKEMIFDRYTLSPYEISIVTKEYPDETVSYLGYDFYYSSYIGGFGYDDRKESLDKLMHYDWEQVSSQVSNEARLLEGAELEKVHADLAAYKELEAHITDSDKLTYKAHVTFADGCTAEVIYSYQNTYVEEKKNEDGTCDTSVNTLAILKFSTPVYEEEILEIYLLRESDGSRVTLYKKP